MADHKKEVIVEKLKEQLGSAKGAVFTTYSGLTVAQDTELRREPRGIGVRLALDVVIERLGHDHDETRAERDEHVRSETRRFVPHLPLVADDAAHDAREHEPQTDFPFLHM